MLRKIPSWLKNKYFLSGVFFVTWMLFFDHNDVFTQWSRFRQLSELMRSRNYYREQISNTEQELDEIRKNPAAIEKVARERYFMKKDHEQLFVISKSQ